MATYSINEVTNPKKKTYQLSEVVKETELKAKDIPGKALENLPSSAANYAAGIYQAVTNPLDTAKNLWDAAAGGLRNALPEKVSTAVDRIDWNPQAAERATNAANNVGDFYRQRYGSMEGFKNTLATDPVGAAADLSGVLYGASALTKAPMLKSAAAAVDPLNVAYKVTKPVVNTTGKVVAEAIGGLGTHTGGESLRQAYKAGKQGGQTAKTFTDNMRGNVPFTDALEAAKANLNDMYRAKSAQYRQGMAKVSADKSVLSFDGIDKSLSDASNVARFKGQVKNTRAAEVIGKIADEIDNWKKLDPAEFHTPEGIDALKQKIGGIIESIPYEEKTARLAAGKVYDSIKSEIVKQAPTYSDVMKDYVSAIDQLKEIEKTFALGNKASMDTAMRKLQSLTRNNANTNYGNRLDLMKDLETKGGREVLPALAGQSLDTWTPRGLGGAIAGGLGLGGYALGGYGLAIPTLALQSPRLMGEATYMLGQGARLAEKPFNMLNQYNIQPGLLGNVLYQAGRLPIE